MSHEEALRKAMACLRLAKSSNPAEAALAAAKAQDIINRYGLDVSGADFEAQDKAKDEEPIKDFDHNDPIDEVPRANRGWALRLLSVVASVNGCRCYQGVNFDGNGGKRLMVVGRPSDVQTVRYLYGYFKNETTRLRDSNTKGNSGAYKNHYCIGVVDAIVAKLREQKLRTRQEVQAEHAGNPLALVRVNNAIAKQEQRDAAVDRALMKVIYGTEEPKKSQQRRAMPAGYTRTSTGGREQGRRDGAGIRITNAKAGLGSGAKAIGGGN